MRWGDMIEGWMRGFNRWRSLLKGEKREIVMNRDVSMDRGGESQKKVCQNATVYERTGFTL